MNRPRTIRAPRRPDRTPRPRARARGLVTRSWRWPRFYRRIYRRVPFLVDPVARALTPRLGTGGA